MIFFVIFSQQNNPSRWNRKIMDAMRKDLSWGAECCDVHVGAYKSLKTLWSRLLMCIFIFIIMKYVQGSRSRSRKYIFFIFISNHFVAFLFIIILSHMASNPMSKLNIGNIAIYEWGWAQIYCPILELKTTLIIKKKIFFNFKDNCMLFQEKRRRQLCVGWCSSICTPWNFF